MKKNTNTSPAKERNETNVWRRVKRLFRHQWMKKIVFTIISGVMVGSLFGLTILHVLKDTTGETAFFEAQSESSQKTTHTSEEASTRKLDLPAIYVVQVGLFHERENAAISQRQLERRKIDSFIWSRNDEHILIESAFYTAEKAKKQSDQLADQEVETFVKQWELAPTDERILKEDDTWVHEFISLWDKSLQQIDQQKEIAFDEWQQLLDTPAKTDQLTTLQGSLLAQLADIQSTKEPSLALLHLLYEFERATTP